MPRTLVGTRIRERRRAAGLTQIALAKAVGISPSYLNLIEHNKRGIAGRTLIALARELGMQPGEIAEGGDAETIAQLLEVARGQPETAAEIDRIEEFVGRYPGWARLVLRLSEINRAQAERLRALSDRLGRDPYLSEAMHEILSNITAVRATAGILAEGDVPADVARRFLANLSEDAERLSETAQAMVEFFDAEVEAEVKSPREAADWPSPGSEMPPEPGAQETPVRAEARRRMDLALERMPAGAFEERARALDFDPLRIAADFGADPATVLLRLALVPAEAGFPQFGLIECDMSGAVLLRKPIAELAPPNYSSGCPLWPCYRAFARPRQMLRSVLDLPSGDRVLAYAVADAGGYGGYDLPPLLRSVMVFSADPQVFPPAREIRAPVLAGVHCSVCPRKGCPERRDDYILA